MAGRALIPLAPARVRGDRFRDDERYVRRSFWDKVRGTLGLVPFMEEALAGYHCAIDPATPARVRAVLFAALAYFVLPADVIPDFIAGLGFTDDASVLITAITVVGPHIKGRHRERARRFLARGKASSTADAA